MQKIFPPKLKRGDEVRIIAPSRSLAIISEDVRKVANARLAELGLKLAFGEHINERDEFDSSSIDSRVNDFHAAFRDPKVKAVIAVIGGYNCNQILRYLDWNMIQKNPKIFCGFSDITALNNAIFAKTGLVTYSGPMYVIFGHNVCSDYTFDHFPRCLFEDAPIKVTPSETWTEWHRDDKESQLATNERFWVINEGQATGTILGGNLCTFNLLQGTEYFPDLAGSILLLEDDSESAPGNFDRDLQSLIHLPSFAGVRGIVIGRFQKASKVTRELLTRIVKTKKELEHIPVIGNADFGHTSPIITFPVGGEATLQVTGGTVELTILRH